jgi:hypothetical protein
LVDGAPIAQWANPCCCQRSYFALMRKIAQTSAFNDRRLKKDALVSVLRGRVSAGLYNLAQHRNIVRTPSSGWQRLQ